MEKFMRKRISCILAAVIFCLLFFGLDLPQACAAADTWDGSSASSFAGGTGSAVNPYQIATAEQLAYLSDLCATNNQNGVYFILTSDLDLSGHEWTPIGNSYFRGNFNGNHHVIYNLTITSAAGSYVGLFANIADGTVTNLGLEDVSISADATNVGGLAGQATYVLTGSTIKNCYVTGAVENQKSTTCYTGGLVGNSEGSTSLTQTELLNCSSTAEVTGSGGYGYCGGLCGRSVLCSVRNCYAAGNIVSNNIGDAGILIGYASTVTFSYAYWNSSAVTADTGGSTYPSIALGVSLLNVGSPLSKTAAEMQAAAFVTALNNHNEGECTWIIAAGTNGGYPVPFLGPALSLSPSADYTFPAQIEGYGAQTPHTVTVSNLGTVETGALAIALGGTNASAFALSKTGLTGIAGGGSDSFTVAPETGLSPGAYTATVTVSGDAVDPVSFNVSFTVIAATYTITADPTALDFGSEIEGYSPAPAAQDVVITNTGNLSVTVTLPSDPAYTIATADSLALAPGATATVSVQPKTGLAVGTYTPTLTFTTDHSTSADVAVSFTVIAATYTITADPISLDFGSEIAGYSPAPSAQDVVITNTGNSSATVTLPTNSSFDITTSDSLTLAAGATATVSVQPKTGLTAGTYNPTLTFTTDHSTSADVAVSFIVDAATYTITANPASLDFGSAIEGYSPVPDAQDVVITNTGNLSVTVTIPTHSAYTITTGDSLALAAGATATVSIRPKAGLTAGTYASTLMFSTDHSTSADVSVTFSVIAAAYTISANPSSLDFGSEIAGYSPAPAAQDVVITNTGNLSVTVTLPSHSAYAITSADSLTLAAGATATVSIQPKTGLLAGTYAPMLTFTTDHSTSVDVSVTFTVIAASYTISATPTSLDFGSEIAGYSPAPAAQNVTITNTGNLSVTVTLPSDPAYTITTADSLTLAPGATATVSVQPKTGLLAGTYNPTLTFTTDHSTSADVAASFIVDAATHTITANPTSLDFGSEIAGYSPAPSAQDVVITNTGNLSVTVTLPSDSAYTITTGDSLTLAAGGTATVSVQPKTGLLAGSYNPTLTFTTDHSTSADVAATFTVDAASYTISVNPTSLDFGSEIAGYSPAPAAQNVTITNTGNLSVTVTLPTDAAFTVTSSDSLTLAAGATATVSVQPKIGLMAGIYAPTLTFTTDHSTSVNVSVTFTVIAASYTISASPTSLDFGSEIAGYSPAPAAQNVTITNTGNLSVTVTLPSDPAYTITTGDSLALAAGATATISIQPKTGLLAGTYNPTLTFTTDHSTSADVSAAFTVTATSYTITADPASLSFGSAIEGYSPAPDAQNVVITNTGNSSVTVTLPTDPDFDIITSDSLALAASAAATVSIRPKTGLAAGAYTPTLAFTTDHSTGADVSASFTVNAAVYRIIVMPSNQNFGSAAAGYTPVAAETFTVTNTGNRIIALTKPVSVSYAVGDLNKTVLNAGDFTTFTVNPMDGLPVGTYLETLTITGSENATADLVVLFTVTQAEYTITGGGTYYLGSVTGLTFISNGELVNFTGVTINGTLLAETLYSAKAGSTVITLFPEYLNTLPVGSYMLRALFTDGYAQTAFAVGELAMPPTGDSRPVAPCVVLAALSLAVLFLLRRRWSRR